MPGRLGFQLLAEVNRSPFASYAELGRRLGVTGEAVRQRLGHLRDDGVLRGFSAIPAASVFGRQSCDLIYETSVDMDLLLEQPDVVYAVESVDGRWGVKGYVHDVSAFTNRMNDFVGEAPYKVIRGPGARAKDALNTIDLRVMRALIEEPRASFRDLQSATGLSYRTVRSRRQRLVDTGAIVVQPILRPSRSGDIYHNLWVQGPACANEGDVLRLIDDHVVLDRGHSPPAIYLFCHEDSLEAHVTMIESLRRAHGIDEVEVVLNNEYRLAQSRVFGWIDELLAAWGGNGAAGTGHA